MRSRTILGLIGIWAIVSCVACNKDNGKEKPSDGEIVSKTTVTFGSSRYVNGLLRSFALKAGDEVALEHVASGERSVASPVTVGSNSSMFLFDLKKPATGDLLLGYYPVSANITVQASGVGFSFPAAQDGTDFDPMYLGTTKNSGSAYAGNTVILSPMSAIVQAMVQKGLYSVVKAELKGNEGEGISGNVTYDFEQQVVVEGSGKTITVTPASPLDCSSEAQTIPVILPPVNFKSGFTITYTLSDGETIEYVTKDPVSLAPGAIMNTNPASSGRQLLACGGGRVYLIDEKLASATGDYKSGLLWTWIAREHASEIGRSIADDDHIDDAKPVDGNKNILVTSSNGWAALVEIETGKVLWSAKGIANAHSAEVLPNGRIAVAVSDGGDVVKIYNRSTPDTPLASYSLKSAHGVVWSEKMQRLYAIGATSVQIYKLKNWDGGAPELELERTESSSGFVSGLHDMTLVDENTLIMGGNKAALYDMNTRAFTSLPHFSSYAGVKSINYNPSTGEAYYTYAWNGNSEGAFAWSTHTIRYTDDIFANDGGVDKKTIKVNDINMYKVRVFNW